MYDKNTELPATHINIMPQATQLQVLLRWDQLPVRVQITSDTTDERYPSKDQQEGYFEGAAVQLIHEVAALAQTSGRLLRAYYRTVEILEEGGWRQTDELLGIGFRADDKDYIIMPDGGLGMKNGRLGIDGVPADEFVLAMRLFIEDGESDSEAGRGTALELLNRRERL